MSELPPAELTTPVMGEHPSSLFPKDYPPIPQITHIKRCMVVQVEGTPPKGTHIFHLMDITDTQPDRYEALWQELKSLAQVY